MSVSTSDATATVYVGRLEESLVHLRACLRGTYDQKPIAPIPEPVWNFHIGGYQVIEKYLKSRNCRTLTLDEVTTVENIVAVLAFTLTQMAAIDTAYHAAFPTHA